MKRHSNRVQAGGASMTGIENVCQMPPGSNKVDSWLPATYLLQMWLQGYFFVLFLFVIFLFVLTGKETLFHLCDFRN